MTREVHAIPPAPRHCARWSTALWYRWPLAALGFVFTVYGGLWTLMFTFAQEGKPRDDAQLDRAAQHVEARILEVKPTHTRMPAGQPAVRVDYEFRVEDVTLRGHCLVAEGPRVGDTATAEYLGERPEVNRIAGGRISLLRNFASVAFVVTIVPGCLLLLSYAIGVLRTRHLLVHGDIAVANIRGARVAPFVVPTMLAVDFTFRDRNAIERSGRHWVRERSVLGERLRQHPETVAVVHDRDRPSRYRLITADEFAAE